MEEKATVRKVKTKWVISLPKDAKVLVKNGDEVVLEQKLVEIKIAEEKMLDLTSDYGGLSYNNWQKLGDRLMGMTVAAGENIFGSEAVFGKRPKAAVSGEVVKIDEFRNVYVRSTENKIKVITSPVHAKVSKVDEENLVLDFRAEEYPGVGITEGKVWGSGGLKFAEHLTDLSVKDVGRIVLVDELNKAMLIKAVVVGIKGVVVLDSGVDDNDIVISELPILKVEGDKFFRLRKYAVDEDTRVLLNSSGGRLLLCLK